MRSCFLFLVLLTSFCIAATTVQTDWADGYGVTGPVTDWESSFCSSSDVDFQGGVLKLYEGDRTTVSRDFDGAISIHGIDMDDDGDIDMLGAAKDAEDVIWWENTDGTGKNWEEHMVEQYYTGVRAVHAADVDGDGDMDVLGASSLLGGVRDVVWWENTDGGGTAWTEHVIIGTFYGARAVFAVDMDADDDLDVFAAASYLDDISWWENLDGTGTSWSKRIVTYTFDGASEIYVDDLDGDGDLDVVGAAIYADQVAWWENIAAGQRWESHPIEDDFNCPVSLHVADLDGDDDLDVLGAAALADDVTWWENSDGSGESWEKHCIDEEFDAAYSIFAADMDNDSDLDVLGAGFLADDVTWWENRDGSGSAWLEHTVNGDFDGAASIHAADVNGDGDNDIMAVAHFEDEITWWDIAGHAPSGVLESSILDAGDVDHWDIFLSNSDEPPYTSVSFQFRSSDNPDDMGEWSEAVYTPDTPLEDILADKTRYLQYRVILETAIQSITPELADVAFSYTIVDIDDSGTAEVESWSLQMVENPSYGLFSVSLTVPQEAEVQLVLFDLAGRTVAENAQDYPAGTHTVSFHGLSEGVYFCTMNAGDVSLTERMVVLD